HLKSPFPNISPGHICYRCAAFTITYQTASTAFAVRLWQVPQLHHQLVLASWCDALCVVGSLVHERRVIQYATCRDSLAGNRHWVLPWRTNAKWGASFQHEAVRR